MKKSVSLDLQLFTSTLPDVPPPTVTPADVATYLQTLDENALMRIPAFGALLGRVRQQEKDKLYSEMEQLRADVTRLVQAQDAAAAETQRKIDEARQQEREGMSAEQRVAATANDAMTQMQRQFAQVTEQLQETQRQLAQTSLNAERDRIIRENNIPADFQKFVQGDTVTKLQESAAGVKEALSKFAPITPATDAPVGPVAAQPMPPANRGIVDPSQQGQAGLTAEKLATLTTDDYAEGDTRKKALAAASDMAKQIFAANPIPGQKV